MQGSILRVGVASWLMTGYYYCGYLYRRPFSLFWFLFLYLRHGPLASLILAEIGLIHAFKMLRSVGYDSCLAMASTG